MKLGWALVGRPLTVEKMLAFTRNLGFLAAKHLVLQTYHKLRKLGISEKPFNSGEGLWLGFLSNTGKQTHPPLHRHYKKLYEFWLE